MDNPVILDAVKLHTAIHKIKIKVFGICNKCNGSGEIDVAHHGSAEWQTCPVCNGKGEVIRPVTDTELAWLHSQTLLKLCNLSDLLADEGRTFGVKHI